MNFELFTFHFQLTINYKLSTINFHRTPQAALRGRLY